MCAQQSFEAPETYIIEELDVPLQHGGPMWSIGNHFNENRTEQFNAEINSIHDEATRQLQDSPPSFVFVDSQGSDTDLNNITPSLIAPIVYPVRNRTGPPARGSMKGPYDFSVMINGANTHKNKFLWSTKVQRMYVDAECDFPLSFSWADAAPAPAYVRATVVFREPDQSQCKVETCINHQNILKNRNLPPCQKSNVLHSSRAAGARGVTYCGGPDEWFSTRVMFDDDVRTHAYRFICKNSCPGGINRRAIDIIFTLEDEMERIYGREEISVRVCACPRRDLRTDEENAPAEKQAPLKKKRKIEPKTAESKVKKVKIEVTDGDDDRVVTLPELRVRGVSTAITTLEMMKEFTAQHKRLSTDPRVLEEDAGIIADLETKISELRGNM
ncbi:cellular tumor antigen p53 [Amyelois transitella]|uniref:cellular tumor antigen p53 n=1 Tax=Amyelois transitella TaxID=680683 RepID=UPI00067BCA87|nr:cellular tumor antigen p53 [Amyelois transitella]